MQTIIDVSLLSGYRECLGCQRGARRHCRACEDDERRALALVLIIQAEDNTASLAAACAKYYSDSDGYHTPA